MQEEEPYPRQPDNDNEDDDSFFAKEDKSEQQQPSEKQENKPKAAKSKKKHINKKEKLPAHKKPHSSKEKEKEMRLYLLAEKQADEIIAKMKYYFEKDIELQEKRRLACQKINYLEELGRSLKNVYVCEKFIERYGLSLFERWMDKITINDETVEPGVSLRKGVMEILLAINFNPENISKTNEIQRLVVRQKRSQVKELRQLSEQINLKWNKISYEAE